MVQRPSFTALKAFEALVRCGSIHKAADDLCVSPGAVSQQIRILESNLERKLFDRSARSMKPTRDALELAEEVSGAFDKIYQAVDQLAKSRSAVQLNIATLPSVANRVVLPRLSEFRERLPNTQLSFSYIHRLEDVNDWDTDVLICAVDTEFNGDGESHELFSGAVRPYASAEYIRVNGPFSCPTKIARSKLLHDFSTKAWRSWFKSAGLDGSRANEGDVFEDFELLVHAALADQGIALCPPPLIAKELETGQLQPVFDRSVLKNRNYIVVVPEQAKEEATVFANWLVSITNNIRHVQ